MDTDRGRKTVGGKIEVILKIREPLVDKDIEVVNEKWLVLDSHLRTLQMVNNTSCPDIYLLLVYLFIVILIAISMQILLLLELN